MVLDCRCCLTAAPLTQSGGAMGARRRMTVVVAASACLQLLSHGCCQLVDLVG
jgi:hypothetical protein